MSGLSYLQGIKKNGIVTRCPLELKLKKTQHTKEWKGKIEYSDTKQDLNSASEVEAAVIRAQNAMAGEGVGISHKLISLEISSHNVPDLTLIDLPGIARVAVGNQPADIGQQIISLIKKYITKQETINLVVVPGNVDIATTEALKMAQEVDPQGERTLGIVTKPDLVDKGTEEEIVDVVRNQRVPLRKGYMIVKCRGQKDINKKVGLRDAIQNERRFFENHIIFRSLLEEGKATIPILAERLTQELIEHINKSLPTLEKQIKDKLEAANIKLQRCGQGVPETRDGQMLFLIEKIKHFNQALSKIKEGEDVLMATRKQRLLTSLRQSFNQWQTEINSNELDVRDNMREEVSNFENKYRGKELPGFANYKTFEVIIKQQIEKLKFPAIEMLKEVAEHVRETFVETAFEHFKNFQYLFRAAQNNIEDIKQKQEEKAESQIMIHFKLESVVYCQDQIYNDAIKDARTKAPFLFSPMKNVSYPVQKCSLEEMAYHLNAYFKSAGIRLGTQIPMIILGYVLHDYAEELQNAMMQLLQDKDQFGILLQERKDSAGERATLKERIKRLTKARQRLARFPV
ncbi:interferon-induced GTP-binding protein Mx1-like isoform X2 [Sceloporus undulatus]|uniref:interferon-induced GTP-binding protein Mx1-like isoform X2 n=1 Tax=Sceloporus undulatus TaxID=8520 RepID=UPI001C4DCFE4|nr:interferon-induced GTP-binding protein Mx1-like isoform X2 [Sceloporus undulatus]